MRALEARLELARSKRKELELAEELESELKLVPEEAPVSGAQSQAGAGGTLSAWLVVCWGVVTAISRVVCGVCRSCGVGARLLPAIPSLLLHMFVSVPRGYVLGLPECFQLPAPFFFLSWFVAATSCAIVVVGVGGAGAYFTPHLWYPP